MRSVCGCVCYAKPRQSRARARRGTLCKWLAPEKAAGEKKFSQFIGAMLKYREKHSRFQLFGRFLELYDELSEDDIRLYMDILQVMYKTVLNF